MASVNKVILVGNLGRDPETRYTTSGDAVTNIRLATTDTWKDKSGEKQERTEWHNIVFYGRQAEIAGEYLKKGRQIYVEGRLQTRKWQDKEGQDRYTTEIIADRMQMLGARDSSAGQVPAEPAHEAAPRAAGAEAQGGAKAGAKAGAAAKRAPTTSTTIFPSEASSPRTRRAGAYHPVAIVASSSCGRPARSRPRITPPPRQRSPS